MNSSKKFTRKSETSIRELLSLQEKYEGSVTSFCIEHKIHKATFYNWRERYRKKPLAPQTFLPVHIKEPAREAGHVFAEIELASNILVRLFEKVDATYFKSLL